MVTYTLYQFVCCGKIKNNYRDQPHERDRRYESGSGKKLFELFWALTIRHQESKPIVSNTVVCYVVLLYTISDHEGSEEQGECTAREPHWQWKESCLTVCLSCLAEADAWYVVAIVYHECIVL